MTRYQIINGWTCEKVGQPYKNKNRARNRCDKLDMIHGSYVHFLETVETPADILAVSTGSMWEGG